MFLIQKLFTVGTPRQAPAAHRHDARQDRRPSAPPSRSSQYVSQDVNPDIRGAGIYAIGEIADRSASEELQRFSDNETDPRLKRSGE